MSAARATCQTLIGFGIDPVKAEEASKRYDDNVAAAVDWCFGPGMDVCPCPDSTDISSACIVDDTVGACSEPSIAGRDSCSRQYGPAAQ